MSVGFWCLQTYTLLAYGYAGVRRQFDAIQRRNFRPGVFNSPKCEDRTLTIACLGWGSLYWQPRGLPVAESSWQTDGPSLPLEFARQSGTKKSDNGPITLVIVEGLVCPVLWTELIVPDLLAGVQVLADREDIRDKNINNDIGRWPSKTGRSYSYVKVIAEWAAAKGLDGVVWTALPCGLKGSRNSMPSLEQIVGHLKKLRGQDLDHAAEYIRNAPPQITTPFRRTLERVLLEVEAERAGPEGL